MACRAACVAIRSHRLTRNGYTDDESAAMEPAEACKRGLDLAIGAGLQDMKLHTLRAGRFLRVSDDTRNVRVRWVHEQADCTGLRNNLGNQVELLRHQFDGENTHAGEVASGSRQASDKTSFHRVVTHEEN